MAMTGLQIQKLLPKTNCKECGSNTCLAFAMKLASKKAELSECPYASEEAKQILGAASEPPVKTVAIGDAKVGGETVMYRHEKTFVNQSVLAVNINDTDADIEATVKAIKEYVLERVGEVLTIGAIAVTQKDAGTEKFVAAVKAVADAEMPVILRGSDAAIEAAAPLMTKGGIIACVTEANADKMVEIAKANNNLVLSVAGETVDDVAKVTAKIKEGGYNELLMQLPSVTPAQMFQLNTIARRAAFANFKPMGYAMLSFIDDEDDMDIVSKATTGICKYDGVIVFPKFDIAIISTIMTLRQNIYTDPQKPIQVEPGVYKIGEPDENSYIFCTTNFSLTYFLVSGEIENCGISAWLVIPECEGLSVLTAWAAGKFSGEHIAKFFKETDLFKTNKNQSIIIPGYVAQISGELRECLPGWNVMISSQEAADIEGFVKANLK